MRHQQSASAGHYRSHSLAGEARTGVVRTVQINSGPKSLTNWRGEERRRQQGANANAVQHGKHSLAGESRTVVISREEIQFKEGTHSLESQG